MDVTVREELARALRRRRVELLEDVVHTETDLRILSEEREAEWSDSASEERLRHLLAELDVRGQTQLGEIEAALQRISEGTYGVCESCGHPIPLVRLRAIPTTTLCTECAHESESTSGPTEESRAKRTRAADEESATGEEEDDMEEEDDTPRTGPLPADLQLLSDEELDGLLWEQVHEDGRVETEELEMTCRQGVVHLGGALPSRAQHSILLQIVTDVMGFQEVVDHIEIEQLAWQREDRDKESRLEEESEALGEGKETDQEMYGSQDIIESPDEVLQEPSPLGQPTPEEE